MDGAEQISNTRSRLKEGIFTYFSWLAPGRSLISGMPLGSGGRFGAGEFADLAILCPPVCDACGLPFERAEDAVGQLCAGCAARPPRWNRARAALIYNDDSRKLILALKRRGDRNGLSVFARLMSDVGGDLISTADLIVPVPIHFTRLASRGFNQAGWLAGAISRLHGVPVRHGVLKRVKATPSQGRMSAGQRRRNVAGAFALTESGNSALQGKRVLIVDDVYTTGATLNACARAIKQAGPANIDVVTLARVVGPANPTI